MAKEVIPLEERNVKRLLTQWLEYNFSLLLKELDGNFLLPVKPAVDYNKNLISVKSLPRYMTSDELRMARKTCFGIELKAVNKELRKFKIKCVLIKLSGNPKFKLEAEKCLNQLDAVELKALDLPRVLNWIKNKILNLFFIPDKMRELIDENVASSFLKGCNLASRQVNTQFSPNLRALKASQELTYNEINNMTSELREDIKRVFEREILAGSSSHKILGELRKLKGFKGNNNIPAIARNELHRACGTGWNNMLKDIGFDGDKQWSAVIDNRTSELCRRNNQQTVPFNKPFKDSKTGGEWMHNPFHINCRCTTTAIPKGVKPVTQEEIRAELAKQKELITGSYRT